MFSGRIAIDMWCEASGLGFVEQCLIVVAGVDKNEWLLGGGWLCGGWTVLDIKGGVSTKDWRKDKYMWLI